MAKIRKKCPCGCKETDWKIGLFGFFIWYFMDGGSWWFRIGTPWKVVSYSPCQGLLFIDPKLFKEGE